MSNNCVRLKDNPKKGKNQVFYKTDSIKKKDVMTMEQELTYTKVMNLRGSLSSVAVWFDI